MGNLEKTRGVLTKIIIMFGARSTALEVAKAFESRAAGRLFLITGGYGGLGQASCEALLEAGATCYVVGRNPKTLEKFLATKAEQYGDRVQGGVCDLGDLDSVAKFSKEFLEKYKSLDVLINNAGVMNTPQGATAQGFETQWGVNVVGTFLLTKLLLPALKAADGSRIVFLSSVGHSIHGAANLNLDYYRSYDKDSSKYDGWVQYQQSKLGDILLAKGFSKLQGVDSAALHPGVITESDLNRDGTFWGTISFLWHNWSKMERMKNMQQGASTTVLVSLTDKLKAGAYYADCAEKEPAACALRDQDVDDLFDYLEDVTAKYQ